MFFVHSFCSIETQWMHLWLNFQSLQWLFLYLILVLHHVVIDTIFHYVNLNSSRSKIVSKFILLQHLLFTFPFFLYINKIDGCPQAPLIVPRSLKNIVCSWPRFNWINLAILEIESMCFTWKLLERSCGCYGNFYMLRLVVFDTVFFMDEQLSFFSFCCTQGTQSLSLNTSP